MTACLPDCSDGELAALALGGRQAAYGELVRRHQGWVHRLVRSHVGSMDEALDVTQASRSEEHTSELQSLMRISYAVFCLKKKKNINLMHITPYTAMQTHQYINRSE